MTIIKPSAGEILNAIIQVKGYGMLLLVMLFITLYFYRWFELLSLWMKS